MITRREFLQAAVAVSAFAPALNGGLGGIGQAAAAQSLSQDDLLSFKALGQVTLLHFSDLHAQLKPVYFREPSLNLGGGGEAATVPHLTGQDFLDFYNIKPSSRAAYALSSVEFVALAKSYGKMGGVDRLATLIEAVRAERPGACLLLDGGDSWQGSYTALKTEGQDVIDVMALLKPDAMTGHWEFTYGAERVKRAIDALAYPFLGGNVFDATWEEPVFDSTAYFERGGVKIAVIGQAFPYTPISNPRWMMPDWSFGIREEAVQAHVEAAKRQGAGLVVLLSHNGFDVDAKMAARVKGIDVILTGHTHDALPEVKQVGKTLLVASGSNGKFLSRLDLDVAGGEVKNFAFKLIPIFSDVVSPAKDVSAKISEVRAPFEADLNTELGRVDDLLYRRGTFNGSYDDLICTALREEMEAEIALSPGFRWGTSLVPGDMMKMEDLYNATAITYPSVYKADMTGTEIKAVLEDVADNLFNEDPYYAQGGDMVRVGGLAYRINPAAKAGARISELRVLEGDVPLEASRTYKVAGWASVNENVQGPPIWEVVTSYLKSVSAAAPDKGFKVGRQSQVVVETTE